MGIRQLRVQGKRLAKAGDCVVNSLLPRQRQPKIVVRTRLAGVQTQGLAKAFRRLRQLLLTVTNITQVVMGAGMIGVQKQRPPVTSPRLFQAFLPVIGVPKIVMSIGPVGLEPHSFLKAGERRLMLADGQQGSAQIGMCRYMAGLAGNDLAIKRGRRRQVPLLMSPYGPVK